MASHRRQGPGRRTPRDDRRDAPARQAQAFLHARISTTATTSSSSTPRRWCSPAASATRRSITTTPATSAASKSAPPSRSSRARYPERIVEKAVERMLPRGPAGPQAARQSQGLQGPRPSARRAVADAARRRQAQSEEQPERLIHGRDTSPPSPISRVRRSPRRPSEAPVHVQKLDKHGRAYATGKRKNAVARVWIKPGKGKATVNGKPLDVYFARPVLRMILNQPLVVANRLDPVRPDGHGRGRRPLRPGRRGAPRPRQGADLLRAGTARPAEERGLPHPRLARRRAQEVRPQEGARAASSSRSAEPERSRYSERAASAALLRALRLRAGGARLQKLRRR